MVQLQRPGHLIPLSSGTSVLVLVTSTQVAADRKVSTRLLQYAWSDGARSTTVCKYRPGLARGIPDLENAGTTANQTYRVLQVY